MHARQVTEYAILMVHVYARTHSRLIGRRTLPSSNSELSSSHEPPMSHDAALPYLERAVIPAPCGDDESGPDRGRSVTTVGAHPHNRYKQTSTYTCLEKRARW